MTVAAGRSTRRAGHLISAYALGVVVGAPLLTAAAVRLPRRRLLILVALAGVDRRIDLAARGCGATVTQRALRVILPNIRFGVLMAALLSFVLSWEEIGVMWMGVHDNVDPAIAAVSVVLIAITTLVLIGRMMFQRSDT